MKIIVLSVIGFASLCAVAQVRAQAPVTVQPAAKTFYSIIDTSHTTQAVNYQNCKGLSGIDFAGTSLMPNSDGKAKVQCNGDTIEVEAEFRNLLSPTGYGSEYLTYVLWAISPEGHAENLGELLVDRNNRSKLKATTHLQAFSLIVTAEPYYAVREPSSMLVLENMIRANSNGASQAVAAKYEVIGAGGYRRHSYASEPVAMNSDLPLSFYEAKNAVRIAKSQGADENGGYSYQHALLLMQAADEYASGKHVDKNHLDASARVVIQVAEEARAIAAKRNAEPSQEDKPMNFNPEQGAPQAVLVDKSFTDQAQVDASKAQVEQAANLVASSEAVTQARADTDETRKVRMTAEMVQDSANYALDQVPSYKAEARAKLSLRLNTILATRDSVSGLIVSISDMEFEAEQSSLTPGARETLARVAIILAAYPGLNIAVCGYADNAGGDSMNQKLSENRADSVRDYLVKDGVGAQSVSTRCFDDNDAVASNDSSAGRQENRRVELVVSGDLIGDTANVTVGSLR